MNDTGNSERRGGSRRPWVVVAMVVLAAVAALTWPGVSYAVASVSRAELSGDRLRIEGTAAANRTITVDGVAMGTSNGAGQFRVERSSFTAPADCTVDVDDGSAAPVTARLAGCTVSAPPEGATLSAVSLSQTTVVGGTSLTGTVSLTAAAPSAGVVVALSSSSPSVATVPPSVTVPAGTSSASFTVSTTAVTDTQSVTVTATAGGATRSATLTVVPRSVDERGSISLARGCVGPCGGGTVTSEPPGVSCTVTPDSTSGACSNVFFPVGTEVRLVARPDASSSFAGWEFEVSCPDAPDVVVRAGVAHICRPVFSRR